MQITKYLKDENDKFKKVEWQVIPTTLNDERGYEIEGQDGKWLTIISTFSEDAGKNILSINPYTNPGLSKYTELTEEEAQTILEQKRLNEIKNYEEQRKQEQINNLEAEMLNSEELIKKQTKILSATKNNIIYEGDLELMSALHDFDEESLNKLKDNVANIKKEIAKKVKELENKDKELEK